MAGPHLCTEEYANLPWFGSSEGFSCQLKEHVNEERQKVLIELLVLEGSLNLEGHPQLRNH